MTSYSPNGVDFTQRNRADEALRESNSAAKALIRHAEYSLAGARCGLCAILPAGPATRCYGHHSGLVRRGR
jgi:hypothetical protein